MITAGSLWDSTCLVLLDTGKKTDIRCTGAALFFLPVNTRLPLKVGLETVTHVTCARTRVTVIDENGRTAEGWGATPLSVTWIWPSSLSYDERDQVLRDFCVELAEVWAGFYVRGHPVEIGHDFQEQILPDLLTRFNERRGNNAEPMPWLAALVCTSLFDPTLHDAYGNRVGRPVYEAYGLDFMKCGAAVPLRSREKPYRRA